MTPVTRPAPPSTTAGLSSARQTRTRLISEAVVASYIHEISARTGPGAISAIARRRGGQVHYLASRPARARAALRRHEAPRLLVRALEPTLGSGDPDDEGTIRTHPDVITDVAGPWSPGSCAKSGYAPTTVKPSPRAACACRTS